MVNKAVCVLKGDGQVTGTVHFEQEADTSPVKLSGEITGLTAGKHGFHVHALEITQMAASVQVRTSTLTVKITVDQPTVKGEFINVLHVGDLGNVTAGENGIAKIEIVDKMLSLSGPNSIIGRTMVIHEKEDDLGKGNNDESLKTGNAGGRLACGVIGITQ